MTMTVIQHQELGSAQSSITFSSIPQTYTDLFLMLSLRTTTAQNGTAIDDGGITFNGANSNKSGRLLYGQGSGSGGTGTYSDLYLWYPSANATSNTFGNISVYIPNYSGATVKSTSHEIVTENNATFAYSMIFAGLWNSTAAITSLQVYPNGTNFAQYSSATLYGILKGTSNGVTVV
jgi:hypothetical protein